MLIKVSSLVAILATSLHWFDVIPHHLLLAAQMSSYLTFSSCYLLSALVCASSLTYNYRNTLLHMLSVFCYESIKEGKLKKN